MFLGVEKKLERATYCLNNLKALADEAGGFAYIKRDKQQAMRANLDCFFFEIISAKDFFLQGINDNYARLPKEEGTRIDLLKICLESKKHSHALEVVKSVEKKLSDKNSWLWRLNNYRNSATHRELIPLGHEVKIRLTVDDKELFDKIKQGVYIRPIFEGEEIPSGVKRFDIPRENIKTYLFKDPEDPAQENADVEAIPYCEQSLERMRKFLETLYSELNV